MTNEDYLDLVADLDWKKRTAGTKKEKQKAAKTRRHTRNMFETQRRTLSGYHEGIRLRSPARRARRRVDIIGDR